MEWNTKFDWENLEIDLPEVMGGGGGGGGGGGSGSLSVVGNNSSLEDVKKSSRFGFFSCSCDEKKDGICSLDGSVGSVCAGEPFIGLKLGKRTYFENGYAKTNEGSSVFGVPVSTVESKKVKLSVSRCQVDGCSLDLSGAKEYHRKHKVCETHSKSPKVIVGGLEKRFCQQCSRFQSMSEFDEEKRSCRKRLLNHNARRRKLQCEPTCVNSPDPFSSFYTATGSIDALTHSRGVHLSKSTRAEIFDQDAVDIRRALSLLSNSTWGLRELGPHPIYLTGPTMAQHELLTAHHGSQLNTQGYLQANQQPTEYAFQFHHNE